MLHKNLALPPLSLYIHIPWCVRKCPYCDFNSHQAPQSLPVAEYCQALLADLDAQLNFAQGRPLVSIFFGGGTPSLFPAPAIGQLLDDIEKRIAFSEDIEITLEANPGASEYDTLSALAQTSVNRLSFGAQSFQNDKLQKLGRIHSSDEITQAVRAAQAAGFNNINIDLMHGLPEQSVADALFDLDSAIALEPSHLSWYQLTIEANTAYYSAPPILPIEETLCDIQEAGFERIEGASFEQYEVSAFAKANRQSRHNCNYWRFGDYLAIGAGGHAKITQAEQVIRYQRTRLPKDYLASAAATPKVKRVAASELALEFMMNALRLREGVPSSAFERGTGLALSTIEPQLSQLKQLGLLDPSDEMIKMTESGRFHLNRALEAFI